MKRTAYECDRCGAESNGDPYIIIPMRRNDETETLHTKRLSKMDLSVGYMRFCRRCMTEIIDCARTRE